MYSIEEVNHLEKEKFISVFGNVIEHYPRFASYLFSNRPYKHFQNLLDSVNEFLTQEITAEDQKRILNLHPDLAGNLGTQNFLTAESKNEQISAGLDLLSPEEIEELNALNEQYKSKFGFPFVICARENKFATILNGLRIRMDNSSSVEVTVGINEVKKISKYRILNIIKGNVETPN